MFNYVYGGVGMCTCVFVHTEATGVRYLELEP